MKKNDVILIMVVLLFAAVVFRWTTIKKQEDGAYVVVYVDTKEAAVYSLNADGFYPIVTEYGENLLIIRDRGVDMTEADCPDQLCVKQSTISKNGETIVCLPHKVVVEIMSAQQSEMDAIVR